jgi:hypothetical protein
MFWSASSFRRSRRSIAAVRRMEKVAPRFVLAPINLDAIQGKLANIKQEKVANDPGALKRQVAELQRQLAEKPKVQTANAPDKVAIQNAYADGFKAAVESYGLAWQSTIGTMAAKIFREIGEWPKPKPRKIRNMIRHSPALQRIVLSQR